MAWHGRRYDFFRRLTSVLVKSNPVLAMLAGEHLIECLFKTLSSFRFRPENFMVVDYSVWNPAGLAAIANNLPCDFSVRIRTDIKGTQHDSGRKVFSYRFVF